MELLQHKKMWRAGWGRPLQPARQPRRRETPQQTRSWASQTRRCRQPAACRARLQQHAVQQPAAAQQLEPQHASLAKRYWQTRRAAPAKTVAQGGLRLDLRRFKRCTKRGHGQRAPRGGDTAHTERVCAGFASPAARVSKSGAEGAPRDNKKWKTTDKTHRVQQRRPRPLLEPPQGTALIN